MDKYVCELCGYVYDPTVGDPDNGIAPGTEFDELPEDWVCPLCGGEVRRTSFGYGCSGYRDESVNALSTP